MPQELHISNEFTIFNSRSDVPAKTAELLDEAMGACRNAYAPYSEFKVGAALRTSEGKIITGNNQENAAYPSGLCAERVAVFAASASDPELVIDQIVVVAEHNGKLVPAPPCGACRQVMIEYEMKQGTPVQVLFVHEEEQILLSHSVADLLPFNFTSKNLSE